MAESHITPNGTEPEKQAAVAARSSVRYFRSGRIATDSEFLIDQQWAPHRDMRQLDVDSHGAY